MSNSEFEKKVQSEFDDLSFEPSGAVWNEVEAQLPKNKKRRWALFFFPLLLAGTIYFIATLYKAPEITEKSIATKTPVTHEGQYSASGKNQQSLLEKERYQTAIGSENQITPPMPILKSADENSAEFPREQYETNVQKSPHVKMIKPRLGGVKSSPKVSENGLNNNVILSVAGNFKSNIRNAQPEEEPGKNFQPDPLSSNTKVQIADTAFVTRDKSIPIISATKADSNAALPRVDLSIAPTAKEKTKNNKNWSLGLTGGFGLSNLKGGLFTNNRMYADVYSSGSSPGTPTSSPVSPASPQAASASLAIATGIFLEKAINRRIVFHTGLNYSYHSSFQKVGARVDSAGGFLTNSGTTSAGFYYRNGSTEKYKNNLHLVTVPVAFQFRPLQQWPLYVEGGLTASFVISSNVMQFSASRNAYFRNDRSYNHLLFGSQAGIGAQLKSIKVGYRFNYSLSSVIKDASKQHPASSIIYIQLPIKNF